MKCQCEHKDHALHPPYICTNEAVYRWHTIFGTFAVCPECDGAHKPPKDMIKEPTTS